MLFLALQAQDPVDIDGSCFAGTVTVPFAFTSNSKPAYNTGNGNYGGSSPAQITVEWTGSRWEIRVGGGTVIYTNSEDTPLPPDDLWSEFQVLGSCTSPSTIFVSGGTSSIVPVELTAFEADAVNASIQLSWSTASELNNDFFQIERSTDGRQFTVLGTVAGQGTTTEAQSYSYMDNTPNPGANYYRLKQVDFDGQSEYSDMVQVQMNAANFKGQVNLYPNPVSDQIFVEGAANVEEIKLTQLNGQLIRTINMGTNGDYRANISLAEVPAGMYVLEIKLNTGESLFEKISKQ